MRLVRIVPTQPSIDFTTMLGRVNSTTWLGRATGTCFLSEHSIQQKNRSGPYRLIFKIAVRKWGWQPAGHPDGKLPEVDFSQLGLAEEHVVKGRVPTKW